MNKQITTITKHPSIRKLHTSKIWQKNNNKQINQSAATITNHNDNPSKTTTNCRYSIQN